MRFFNVRQVISGRTTGKRPPPDPDAIRCSGATGAGRSSQPEVPLLVAAVLIPLLLILAPTPTARAGQSPPRVLVVYSEHRLFPTNLLFDENFRETLDSSTDEPIEYHGEYLDETRFPARYQERMHTLLLEKYAGRPPHVMVAFGPRSLDFCLSHRSRMSAAVPIVFAGMGVDTLDHRSPDPGVTGVRSSYDPNATLDLALRLHPGTRKVFLIRSLDAIDQDDSGVELAHTLVARPHVTVHVLPAGPLPALLRELAALPDSSLVMDLSAVQRGFLNFFPPLEEIRHLSEASRAPIYGIFDPLIGRGLVGAVTTPVDSIGRATASLVLEVLSRKEADHLPPPVNLAPVTLIDWRQLRRWGLSRNKLPPESILRFAPTPFWREHLLIIIASGAIFLLQSGLILSLVLQSRRRRRAEMEARHRREELAHMTRVATLGELTASLAHEINQPLTAILSNAQAGQLLLASGGENSGEIAGILADIVADDQRAGEVIRRMRELLRKGTYNPTELDLNQMLEEILGLVHGEMILHEISLALQLSPAQPFVHGDRVQLQQVVLNLVMNAMDAMKDTPAGSRRLMIGTAVDGGGRSVEVTVCDNGSGLGGEPSEQLFQPFYTTKPHGLGLGLAICRSIVLAHGGSIGFRENTGAGVTFWLTLPVIEETQP